MFFEGCPNPGYGMAEKCCGGCGRFEFEAFGAGHCLVWKETKPYGAYVPECGVCGLWVPKPDAE